MTVMLSPPERTRLIALLGLLGSDFEGERASAALLASRLLKGKQLTWDQVIATTRLTDDTEKPSKSEPADDHKEAASSWADPLGQDWRATAIRCGQYSHLINRWESDFLDDLPRFPRLSEKQRQNLVRIVTRLKACGCAL